jgi:hypothetical protein
VKDAACPISTKGEGGGGCNARRVSRAGGGGVHAPSHARRAGAGGSGARGTHLGDGADELLGGERKLVVQRPLGLAVEAARGVERDGLVVLDGLVVPRGVEVRNLHEEARDQRLADVYVVVLRREFVGRERELEARHEARELLAHRVARLQRAGVKEVVVGPLLVLPVRLPGVVGVQQREVVAVDVREARFGLVRRALRLLGPHEDVGRGKHRDDGEDLVAGASEVARRARGREEGGE